MFKKNFFKKYFSKIVLSITKRIESFFNLWNDWNSIKKKYLYLWKNSLDKIIFISLAVIILSVITYFSLPSFYNKDKVETQIKDQILKQYNFKVKFDENLKYGLFPKPHFSIENVKIYHDAKIISNSENTKFFISIKNLFLFNKIKVKNIVFGETDFKINSSNFNFFVNLLNNKINFQNLEFIKSKLFYLDQSDNVIFFTNIENLIYINEENFLNTLISKLEIFNLPINLNIQHNILKKKILSEIYINSLKLKIQDYLNYNKSEINGELILNFFNNNKTIQYSLVDKNLEFNTIDEKAIGEINIKPFFLSSNISLQDVRINKVYENDSIIFNLLKSEILNNKNLNGKISVSIENLNNFKFISPIKFDIKLEEGNILISNLNFSFKNSVFFDFNDVNIIVDDNNLKFIGDIVLEFKNIKNFYSHFQIRKKYRKNIDRINSGFVFNFDNQTFELVELIIEGVDKKISKQYQNNFNSEKKDLFNKVTFRNTIRDFFKIITLD